MPGSPPQPDDTAESYVISTSIPEVIAANVTAITPSSWPVPLILNHMYTLSADLRNCTIRHDGLICPCVTVIFPRTVTTSAFAADAKLAKTRKENRYAFTCEVYVKPRIPFDYVYTVV